MTAVHPPAFSAKKLSSLKGEQWEGLSRLVYNSGIMVFILFPALEGIQKSIFLITERWVDCQRRLAAPDTAAGQVKSGIVKCLPKVQPLWYPSGTHR
ncbi:MAG: hypothetical protein ACI4TG_08480 [Ruminococcus sp.]